MHSEKDHDWENLIAARNAEHEQDYDQRIGGSNWREDVETVRHRDEIRAWLILVGVAVLVGMVLIDGFQMAVNLLSGR